MRLEVLGDHLPLRGVGLRAGGPRADLADLLEVLVGALRRRSGRGGSGEHGGVGLAGAEPREEQVNEQQAEPDQGQRQAQPEAAPLLDGVAASGVRSIRLSRREPIGSVSSVRSAPTGRLSKIIRSDAQVVRPGWLGQERVEPLHRQADDVAEAAADDGDERVVVLDAVGPRLPFPALRVEVRRSLGVGQGPEPDDARLDRPDPLPPLGAVEADGRSRPRCRGLPGAGSSARRRRGRPAC